MTFRKRAAEDSETSVITPPAKPLSPAVQAIIDDMRTHPEKWCSSTDADKFLEKYGDIVPYTRASYHAFHAMIRSVGNENLNDIILIRLFMAYAPHSVFVISPNLSFRADEEDALKDEMYSWFEANIEAPRRIEAQRKQEQAAQAILEALKQAEGEP